MTLSRRHFLKTCSAAAIGFAGFHRLFEAPFAFAQAPPPGFGDLVADPDGILDLPRGFKYSIVSRVGDNMADGLLLPGLPDAMATFPTDDGKTIIIRNHELAADDAGAFGHNNELVDRLAKDKFYDAGFKDRPISGGTTTMVYDTKRQKLEMQFLSLVGTVRNCAGGATPWNSWITCEETTIMAGEGPDYTAEKDHGYNFEVVATSRPGIVAPVPLTAMGRFQHEAVAVDPRTSIVYQTEDQHDSLIYRFIPDEPGQLQRGGRLQALVVIDQPSLDTRNWEEQTVAVGETRACRWIDMDDVESPQDDLRYRGFEAGAARFARGEGMWCGDNEIYFACTSGGAKKIGQIFRYVPGQYEGTADDHKDPGKLELYLEPNDSNLVENADNLTVSPWGDIVLCEDRSGDVVRLVCVTGKGSCYTLANNRQHTEFAGAVFSPDGSTLFVNLQGVGLTLAITGPWA